VFAGLFYFLVALEVERDELDWSVYYVIEWRVIY
jgi:hypothetical protein